MPLLQTTVVYDSRIFEETAIACRPRTTCPSRPPLCVNLPANTRWSGHHATLLHPVEVAWSVVMLAVVSSRRRRPAFLELIERTIARTR